MWLLKTASKVRNGGLIQPISQPFLATEGYTKLRTSRFNGTNLLQGLLKHDLPPVTWPKTGDPSMRDMGMYRQSTRTVTSDWSQRRAKSRRLKARSMDEDVRLVTLDVSSQASL